MNTGSKHGSLLVARVIQRVHAGPARLHLLPVRLQHNRLNRGGVRRKTDAHCIASALARWYRMGQSPDKKSF